MSEWAVHHADCLDVLAGMAEASVDSIVTDPPYGLGFMGKKWDAATPCVEVFVQCLRVLKPGGHLLAFGGTRTYHRLAVAIEDAGFEIRDCIMWLYGCLDEASEILTADGWKRGLEVEEGELVAAWDHETGAIRLSPVQETFRAPFNGRMVAFKNDNTDQLLTPNHRVYARHSQRKQVKGVRTRGYDTAWTVEEAASINRWNPIQLPLAGYADGPGIGGEDFAALLGWVWTEGSFDKSGRGVRIYQSETANPEKVAEINDLVGRVLAEHKRYDRAREWTHGNTARVVSETTWFFTGPMADRVRAFLPKKRPTWDLLWQMSLREKHAFYDAAMKGDGSATAFYQDNCEDLELFHTLAHLIGKQGRINARKKCVSLHDNPKTELQARHLRHYGEDYDGEVWCVRVETGAFVARRNGRIFITGNSGFPKSMDVSKAIDKAAGVERKKVRVPAAKVRSPSVTGLAERHEKADDNPVTPAARQWQGWGTTLKPACEPIVVARKPLEGTVAATVQKHGTGAFNIYGCRVDAERRTGWGGGGGGQNAWKSNGFNRTGEARPVQGRWPANVIHDGSDEVLAGFPETAAGKLEPRHAGQSFGGDSGSAARFFYCAKASKADRTEGGQVDNRHPTVKPHNLMRYLCRLVTPPGGTVLDPFAGSGSTGKAALAEGFYFIGIERDAESCYTARARIERFLADAGESDATGDEPEAQLDLAL